jgi:hypothetical protein
MSGFDVRLVRHGLPGASASQTSCYAWHGSGPRTQR